MQTDEIVLPSPARWAAPAHLVFLAGYLAGMVHYGAWRFGFGVLVFGFLFLVSLAAALHPPRLSAAGIRVSVPPRPGYRMTVPWPQVSRIWVDGTTLRVLLHDPGAVAGSDTGLAARMRRTRARHAADLILPWFSGRPEIGASIARFSGGARQLERALVHATPGADDVPIRNRFALPGIVALSALLLLPALAIALLPPQFPPAPRYLIVALLAISPAAVLLLLWLTGSHLAPPVLSPAGLRLRAARLFEYDVVVPWARVDRIWLSRHGVSPVIMVRVHDADALAGDDERLRRRMRANRRRLQADLVFSTHGSALDRTALAAAVARLSQATRDLEHVA